MQDIESAGSLLLLDCESTSSLMQLLYTSFPSEAVGASFHILQAYCQGTDHLKTIPILQAAFTQHPNNHSLHTVTVILSVHGLVVDAHQQRVSYTLTLHSLPTIGVIKLQHD